MAKLVISRAQRTPLPHLALGQALSASAFQAAEPTTPTAGRNVY